MTTTEKEMWFQILAKLQNEERNLCRDIMSICGFFSTEEQFASHAFACAVGTGWEVACNGETDGWGLIR